MTDPARSDEPPAAGDHRKDFVPRRWEPISVKTAWLFLKNFLRALQVLRGVFILMLLLTIGGALVIWLVEDVSLLDSIYFALVTALTIGYGDIVPCTLLGKVASIFIGVLGVVIMGILVAASVRALEFTLKTR
jgi:voltage-gated potassium channel